MKLSDFFESTPEVFIDGRGSVDASRIEIQFPDGLAVKAAIARLVRNVFRDREAALNFLLDVRSKLLQEK
jgi:hypothetical protein